MKIKLNNVTYMINNKSILRDINISYQKGNLYGIMGKSGSGKTSLMKLISCRYKGEIKKGCIYMDNEHVFNHNNIHLKHTAYLQQDEILFTNFTPRQILTYTAKMVSKRDIDLIVYQTLEKMDLLHCADTIIKDGISGGERKRVAIGTLIIKNSDVLFLDEPTSGLDSNSAIHLINILINLSNDGKTIVCTLHQPSWKLLTKFSGITILSKGKCVFDGNPSSELYNYFKNQNIFPRENENAMDIYMEYINNNSPDELNKIWTDYSKSNSSKIMIDNDDNGDYQEKYDRNVYNQICVLIQRYIHEYIKNFRKSALILGSDLATGVLLGFLFLNVCGNGIQSIQTSQGVIFVTLLYIFLNVFNQVATYIPDLKFIVSQEIGNNFFSSHIFYISMYTCEFFIHSLGIVLFTAPLYFMCGLDRSFGNYIVFYITCLLISILACSIAIASAMIFSTPSEALLPVLPISIPAMLFSGFLVPYENIPNYLQWLYNVSFFQYGTSIMLINEFEDKTYVDCQHNITGMCITTGNDILSKLNINENDIVKDFIVLSMMTFFAMIVSYISFTINIKKH